MSRIGLSRCASGLQSRELNPESEKNSDHCRAGYQVQLQKGRFRISAIRILTFLGESMKGQSNNYCPGNIPPSMEISIIQGNKKLQFRTRVTNP